jgi:hypothetical protein
MREEALPLSLPADADTLRKILADCEATDSDIRTRLADIRAMRRLARQAGEACYQSAEARAHLSGEAARLASSLSRSGVISPTIRTLLSIPSAESFREPAEYFRLMLQRITELHAAASRRLVEVQAMAPPSPGPAATPISENPQSPPRRARRTRRLSLIQKAIVIVQYRAKRAGESLRVEEIAAEAGCSAQNLYDSPDFRKVLAAARDWRIRRGWKLDGVADALDDST